MPDESNRPVADQAGEPTVGETAANSTDELPELSTTEALNRLVGRARALGREPEFFPTGTQILHEGRINRTLYILLDGSAEHSRIDSKGDSIPVDLLGPGSLLGILSFWTGRPAFTDSFAATDLTVLRLEREDFERGVAQDPEFNRLTQQLFITNLSDRYRRVVGLNLEVAELTGELEQERNALREAVTDLKQTRTQLIHQEKLATMGQLLAGIAHEINNPSAALMKSVEFISREMPTLFKDQPMASSLFSAGFSAPFLSSEESRERLRRLQERYPQVGRAFSRRLTRLDEESLALLEPDLHAGRLEKVSDILRAFEIGAALHSVHLAEERIRRLVTSVKSYSREENQESCSARLDDCIRDTLTVLNHRLKYYELRLELQELPLVHCCPGEINQIITNLLTNACDATEPGKAIIIRTAVGEDWIRLDVEDEGPGVPEELLETIFDSNVTTKSGGADYGLGLGLAISRELAHKHHGTLTARNIPGGGALFRLELPVW
jgi:signal transduction histidine kinase